MASSYKVGPKPPKAKTAEDRKKRDQLHRDADLINRGISPSRFSDVEDPGKRTSDREVAKSLTDMQLNSGSAPEKGRRLKNTVDDLQKSSTKAALRRKLNTQKDKIGASNPPDGKRKFD